MNTRTIQFYLWGDGSRRFYPRVILGGFGGAAIATIIHYSYVNAEMPALTGISMSQYPGFDASCVTSTTYQFFSNQCVVMVDCFNKTSLGAEIQAFGLTICNSWKESLKEHFLNTGIPGGFSLGSILSAGVQLLIGRRVPDVQSVSVGMSPEEAFDEKQWVEEKKEEKHIDEIVQYPLPVEKWEYVPEPQMNENKEIKRNPVNISSSMSIELPPRASIRVHPHVGSRGEPMTPPRRLTPKREEQDEESDNDAEIVSQRELEQEQVEGYKRKLSPRRGSHYHR